MNIITFILCADTQQLCHNYVYHKYQVGCWAVEGEVLCNVWERELPLPVISN